MGYVHNSEYSALSKKLKNDSYDTNFPCQKSEVLRLMYQQYFNQQSSQIISKLKMEISENDNEILSSKQQISSYEKEINVLKRKGDEQSMFYDKHHCRSILNNLKTKWNNNKDEKFSLSSLVQLKKLEHQVKVQQQTIEVYCVCDTIVCD